MTPRQDPTISGIAASETITDRQTATPFAGVTITELSSGATESVSVTLSNPASGLLSNLGGGSYDAATGVYTDVGSAAAVTADLDALAFNPTIPQAGSAPSATTDLTLSVDDSVGPSTSANTSIVVLAAPVTVAEYLNNVAAYDQPAGGFAISDTAAAITANLGRLDDPKISSITISDDGIIGVSLAELTNEATALSKLSDANGSPYRLAVSDPVDLMGNLMTNFGVVKADLAHIASIATIDASMQLTAAEAIAFEHAHVLLSAPSNDRVELCDTAAQLRALTVAELRGLPNIRVTSLHNMQGAVFFSKAETSALSESQIEVAAIGGVMIGETFRDGAAIEVSTPASGNALMLTAGTHVRVDLGRSPNGSWRAVRPLRWSPVRTSGSTRRVGPTRPSPSRRASGTTHSKASRRPRRATTPCTSTPRPSAHI